MGPFALASYSGDEREFCIRCRGPRISFEVGIPLSSYLKYIPRFIRCDDYEIGCC